MKVVALTAIGHLELQERNMPVPQAGEVLLKVMASGLCGSDVPRAYQTGTLSFPRVLGHEFAGRVEAVGLGGDPALIGKRMAVFPIVPCMTCEFCQQHHYPRCLNYSSYGSRRDGGFSEYLTVRNLISSNSLIMSATAQWPCLNRLPLLCMSYGVLTWI